MKYNYSGLNSQAVERSKAQHGTNQLTPPEVEGFWEKLIGNFKDPIIIILTVALAITTVLAIFGFAAWYEGAGIAVAVIIATLVATLSEYRNETSFQKLQEEASRIKVNVFRDGHISEAHIDDIVVGDYVLLQPGDKIPADGKMVDGELEINQAVLTGESEPVRKSPVPEGHTLEKRDDLKSSPYHVLRGSVVNDGEAVMQVDTVGDKTFLGQLATEFLFSVGLEYQNGLNNGTLSDDLHQKFQNVGLDLSQNVTVEVKDADRQWMIRDKDGGQAYLVRKESDTLNIYASEERKTPLQVKLSDLADGISKFGYIGGTLIAIAFLFKKIFMDNHFVYNEIVQYLSEWQIFLHDAVTAVILSVIIIVVAVPEGLPMMIAIVLSLNMRKLLNAKVLVRKLLGIETAGSLNILFCDKTGTITKGQLQVVEFVPGGSQAYPNFMSIPDQLRSLLAFSLKHNTSCIIDLSNNGKPEIIGGNRTDQSIMEFIEPTLAEKSDAKIIHTIPFSSVRKFSAVQITGEENRTLVKGAPEVILENCEYYYDKNGNKTKLEDRSSLISEIDKLSDRAMRVLAVATSEESITDDKRLPSSLALIGIIGIRDELRTESTQAIKEAQEAGIHVIMVTGDKKETAVAIARECGLLKDEKDIVLTSSELSQLSDEKLKNLLPKLRVVARALPMEDKSRLVKVAQQLGLVAGMTGDGVNDWLALKKADVGFAMGSGTEVAKEAGDVVILDDNLSSITKAILYGRTIFSSIRKFIVFQLTVNVAAILIAFLGPFLGYDLPLTMVQLLWVNLVMDTLAALAFGGEPALARYMTERPKRRDESIITKDMWSSILLNGCAMAILCVFFLKYQPIQTLFHGEAAFMTGFFAFFIFLNNFNKFNARTVEINLFDHILENRGFLGVVGLIFLVQIVFTYFGGDVLRTVGLTFKEWLYIVLFSMIIIPIDLTRKLIRNFLLARKTAGIVSV